MERLALLLTEDGAARVRIAALASRVETTLLSHGGIGLQRLQVVADGSVVYLGGEVIDEEDRELAEEVVLHMPGVSDVINDLRIHPHPLTGM